MGEDTRFRVVRFPRGAANCLRGRSERYFLLDTGCGDPAMVNARCGHRGGPLHLGALSADGAKVICPMHQLGTAVTMLRRHALPMILRSDEVLVIVPEPGDGLSPSTMHSAIHGS